MRNYIEGRNVVPKPWDGVVWADAKRLCPERPLPIYRYIPGQTPHPTRDPRGHSFTEAPHLSTYGPWETCEAYRYGIDLYHYGYFWESHEAWEPLWRAAGRHTLEGVFLQSLILNSAALLKHRASNLRGAAHHGRAAWRLLRQAVQMKPAQQVVLGVEVVPLTAAIESCYRHLWDTAAGTVPALDAAPKILVTTVR
ncbi:MAG: DUF309 domain-containing protein [Candidatus Hydrogenedentes bacterium]|nr:DUF309 domain-containing protein [Candidatus Hydrogenedentota bacterium]